MATSVTDATKQATDQLALFARQLQQVAVASQGAFAALNAGLAAIQHQVVSFVEKANPAAVQKFTFAVQDLQGVIGRALTPLLVNLTAVIQKLADYFYALSPAAKTLTAGLTAAAVGFTVVAVAVIGLNVAFATLTGGLSAILGAVAGLTVGTLLASGGTEQLTGVLDEMMGPLSEVIDAISEVVTMMVSALAPVIETVFGLFASVLRSVADAIQQIMPQLLRMVAWFRAIAEFVGEVLGFDRKAGNAPNKAPSAVRSAQIGGLGEFLNRQLVAALEKPGGKVDGIKIGQGIADDVKEIKKKIEAFLGKAEDLKEGVGRGVKFAAGGAIGDPNAALMWLARRLVENGVVGK